MNKSKMVTITQVEIYNSPLFFTKHWDRFLLSIFHRGFVVLHPAPSQETLNELDKLDIESVSKLHSKSLLTDANFKVVIDQNHSKNIEDLSVDVAIHMALRKAMQELLLRGLVEKGEWDEAPFIDSETFRYAYAMETFVLSQKGVDLALRLQEHLDSERRHNDSLYFSKRAFVVSFLAFTIAAISADRKSVV